MLQSPNFPELRPGPRWRSLQRSPTADHLGDGEEARCPLSRTPLPLSAFRASFLRVSKVEPITELATLLMIDFKM